MNTKLLAKKAKKRLKILRKNYQYSMRNQQDIFDEWLKDNFYILERQTTAAITALKNEKINLEKILILCMETAQQNEPDIYAKLHKDNLRLELDLLCNLPHVMRCCCIIKSAENRQYIPNAVKCFRLMDEVYSQKIIENFSHIDTVFEEDKIFLKMDDATKAYYRKVCAQKAKKLKISEENCALSILHEAKDKNLHIGEVFLCDNEEDKKLERRGKYFLALRIILPLIFSVSIGILLKNIFAPFIFYIPLCEILRVILEKIFLINLPTRFVPRIRLKCLPKEARTLITVSGLVPHPKNCEGICQHLEEIMFANNSDEIRICYLADLKENKAPFVPSDEVEISALKRGIVALNKKHGDKFVLLVRSRVYIETQNAYAGYERKRGALMHLAQFIKGQDNPFSHLVADLNWLKNVKYIYALDSDTLLGKDAVLDMASAALHPLNSPKTDEGIVKKGYGIFTPSVSVSLEECSKTLFAKITGGAGGISAYNSPCSNLYFDLLGQTLFCGKGFINVDAMYDVLKDAFPKERVLSHDILEGGYLRPCFCSFAEVTDGCPSNAFGWYNRLGRWVRGDFQNSLWLCKKIPTQKGFVKNPFPGIIKAFLWDNLVRQTVPLWSVLLILISAFYPSYKWVGLIVGIFALAGDKFLSAFILLIKRGTDGLTRRYYSNLLPDAIGEFTGGIFKIMTAVNTAITSGSSAIKGTVRQYFTRKNLLEWTTAADADVFSKGTLISYISHGYYGICLGVILFAFAPDLYKLLGILFFLCPFILWKIGKLSKQKSYVLSSFEQEKISRYMTEMWRFYADTCDESNSFLPPDNISIAPSSQIARRTSPTNIGLMMLSAFCSMKQGIISKNELKTKLLRCLDSIDKLEKWQGHLLNWYNTKNLQSLHPKYCSMVDSGNFICCVFALNKGIENDEFFKEISKRLKEIIDQTDFSVFYNSEQKLFHIGYDLERQELTRGYYDMLMSEARMTVYYAVAKGQVPREAYGSLSRILSAEKGYSGHLSWTGTAFEYLMPPLLLPVYKGSCIYEGVKYCIFCGKNRAVKLGLPFGCSESGFYAFDGGLNYQYKAHGIQRLGLKRGLNNEYVVSPYSSFLALPFATEYAMKNLEHLKKAGAYGEYGFYEAVDYTKNRCGNAPYQIVQSYMAHHIGMSICALYNALTNFSLWDLFMQDEMLGAKQLLKERIPMGAKVYNHFVERSEGVKALKQSNVSEKFQMTSPITPRGHLLTNRRMTCLLLDNGCTLNTVGDVKIYNGVGDIVRDPKGVLAVVTSPKKQFSITGAFGDNDVSRQVVFSSRYGAYLCKDTDLECGMSVSLHSKNPVEIRRIKIKNLTQKIQPLRLSIYLEPYLSREREFESHPAFNRLFITSRYDSENKILLFEKNNRNGEKNVMGFGFDREYDFEFDTRRERVLKRGTSTRSILGRIKLSRCESGTPDCCVMARLKLRIPPKATVEKGFFICYGTNQMEVVANICKCRRENRSLENGALSLFDANSLEGRICLRMLPKLITFCGYKKIDRKEFSIHSLWGVGISGDKPIVFARVHDEDGAKNLNAFFAMYGALKGCGIDYDFCVVYNQGGEYFNRLKGALTQLARENNSEQYIGNGIYLLEQNSVPQDTLHALEQCACCNTEQLLKANQKVIPFTKEKINSVSKPQRLQEKTEVILSLPTGEFSEGRFVVESEPNLPYCNIIAGENLGTVISDKALGFTFYKNSQMGRLTEFCNDTRKDNRGELLLVKRGNKIYDLLDGAETSFMKNKGIYRGIFEEVEYTVEVTVENDVKKIKFSTQNSIKKSFKIAYVCEPVLGQVRKITNGISIDSDGQNQIVFFNRLDNFSSFFMGMGCSENATKIFDKGSFFGGNWEQNSNRFSAGIFGGLVSDFKGENGNEIIYCLTADQSKEKLNEKISNCFYSENDGDGTGKKGLATHTENSIQIKTPHAELNVLFNTWLPIQFENSRYRARCGFYQAAGGYGFRDQLQDICAIMLLSPDQAKNHIIRCCGVQFEEGDVLHWWHETPQGPSGVRTRCSDDMLWLPYGVCEYVFKTGDADILDISVPFISGDVLQSDEQERYFTPKISQQNETVFEHCLRAVKRIDYAENGLLKIGSCDWNDGFSKVGNEGKGSSVWLSQFYCIVAKRMAIICRQREEFEIADQLENSAKNLLEKIDEICFDGEWYVRAFFDNGEVMGSRNSKEGKIDLLPQAFAVLAGMKNEERITSSLNACMKYLVDDDLGIIRLFSPSYHTVNAGYISSYPEGIRENGGQYTHGALWLIKALLNCGRTEEGYKLLQYINPAYRYQKGEWGEKLGTEPYALPADVYYGEGYQGRGGWSHYTGGAAWYYRIVLEDLLGIKIFGDRVEIVPNIPKDWDGYSADLSIKGTDIQVKVCKNPKGKAVVLLDKKTHIVEI